MRSVGYAIARVCLIVSTVVLIGCTAVSNPIPASPEALWVLSGRLRVSTEESILRADFRAEEYAGESRLRIFGPLGIGRVELRLVDDRIDIVFADGSRQTLTAATIDQVLPNGEWLFEDQLSNWLLLSPDSSSAAPSGQPQSIGDTHVEVLKVHHVNGRDVCKHVRIHRSELRVDILCDRWLLAPR